MLFSLVSLNVLVSLIFIPAWPDLSFCKSPRISQQAETHHPLKLSTLSEMPGSNLWPLPFLIATQAIFKPQSVTAPCSALLHPPSIPLPLLGGLLKRRCVCLCVCVCYALYYVLIKNGCAFFLSYHLNSTAKAAIRRWAFPNRTCMSAYVYPQIHTYYMETRTIHYAKQQCM